MADNTVSGAAFLKRVIYLVVAIFVLALIFRATVATGFTYVFLLLLFLAVPLFFIIPKPLTMPYAIAYWVILGIIYIVPWVAPGTYDGITSRLTFVDFIFGETVRAKDSTGIDIATATKCRNLRMEIEDQYQADLAKIDPSLSISDKGGKGKAARDKANKALADINSTLCAESAESTPKSSVATPTPSVLAVSSAPSTSAGSPGLAKSGAISVTRPFTDVGTYTGKITIRMGGIAKLDSTRENFGPRGWTSGPPAPNFFALSGVPMFSALVKVGNNIQYVGDSITLDLSSPTRIELGPNEEPGQDGLGFKDNGGVWTYEIYKS